MLWYFRKKMPWLFSSSFWTALATVVIAVLTGFYVYYASKQWEAMDSQLKVMDNQLKYIQDSGEQTAIQTDNLIRQAIAQAKATETTANAAISAAETAKKNLELTQRAFLAIGVPETSGNQTQISVPLVNYGHIASKGLTIEATYFAVRDTPHREVIVKRRVRVSGKRAIPPGQGSNLTLLITLPVVPGEVFRKGEMGSLTIFGNIDYDTGFRDRDEVGFCLSYNPMIEKWQSTECSGAIPVDIKKAKDDQQNEITIIFPN